MGFAGYIHLFIFGLLLPAAAIRSAQRLASMLYPPRRKFFVSVIVQHAALIAFSLLAAWMERIELLVLPARPLQSLLAGALFLAAAVALMRPQWKRAVIERERKVYLFMPRTPEEKSLWVLICLLAGFGEEIAYRGVMFILLERLTGSWPRAVLIAAIVFAVGHFTQGWKSAVVIFFFALAFHALVLSTGSLIPAIFAHFAYDLIAGMMYSRFGEEFDYPIDGIPANAD
jgi:membrane protease YdiL (CAAX protease family)